MEKIKKYFAWARLANTARQFVETRIIAQNLKEAKKWFKNNGYEVDGRVRVSKRWP